MGKSYKKRASSCDAKLTVNGSFEEIIKASVSNIDLSEAGNKPPKKAAKKINKK